MIGREHGDEALACELDAHDPVGRRRTTLPPTDSGVAARTLLTALAPLAWGTTYAVTSELLPTGHPLFAGMLRALPAGLIAVAIGKALPTGAWWWKGATLGVLNIGIFFPLLFTAGERLPGGVAGTLGSISPLVVALVGVPLLGERLTAWRVGWGLAGVGGVALVVLGVTLTKRWGRPPGVSLTSVVGWQLSFGGALLVPVTFALEGAPPSIDGPASLGYLWLGLIGGLLAYIIFFNGVGSLPLSSVAPLALLSPLTAATVGAAILGESLSSPQLLGFSLALLSVLAGQFPPPARRAIDVTVHSGGARSLRRG